MSASGALKTVATSMFKIVNDLRWLSSGPRTGFAEITLPSLQPGSSIMPGKVNPVMPEMVMQVAAQVIGNDVAITWGGANGNFELNVMMPLIAHNLLESIGLLATASDNLRERCIDGIVANEERAKELVLQEHHRRHGPQSPYRLRQGGRDRQGGLRRPGVPYVRLPCEKGVMSEAEIDEALDIKKMTEGGIL